MNSTTIVRTLVLAGSLVAAAASSLCGGQPDRPDGPPQNLRLYLLIGGHGAAARAELPAAATAALDRCWLFTDTNTWEPARTAFDGTSADADAGGLRRLGPAGGFAATMLERAPEGGIGLVVASGTGSRIDDWLGKSESYWAARRSTRAALAGGTLEGVIWLGGEADHAAAEGHLDKLLSLVANIRADFNDASLPVVAAPLPGGGSTNEQIARLPTATHAAAVADAEGLVAPDGLRYDPRSQWLLGTRCAERMLRLRADRATAAARPPADIAFIDPHVHAMSVTPTGLRAVAQWMEERNVSRCIVSPLDHKGSRPQTEEERWTMLEHFAQYAGRIDRMCIIKPNEVATVDEAVAILRREIEDGAVGFGEHYGEGLSFDDPANLRLYEACERVGLPVMFHIDQNKNMVEPGMARVDRVLKMFPECRLVAHAYWWRQLANGTCDRQLREHPNLYADMSGSVVVNVLNRDRAYAREFLIRNQDKILWATDEGWWSFGNRGRAPNLHYTFFEELDLPDEVRRKIYRDNAEKVYGLGDKPRQPARAPVTPAANPGPEKRDRPIKAFVLLGDENVLEHGVIAGPQPGTLETVVAQNPKYAFLEAQDGAWVKRNDVVVYDLHPLLNNTVAMGHHLQVGDVPYGGRPERGRIGVELMFGTVMGERFEEPVLLVRYATNQTMSASLGRNYLPPSSGGADQCTGGWDVIHFNWGVWDAMYHDESSKFYQGHGNTTAVADYEQNLRTLVARLKQTGATLIFANTTPVWKGDPDRPNGDVEAFNRVARQVMEENGVIYEDLNAEVRRQGHPKNDDVHSVGNLGPKVVEDILGALAERKQPSRPLPRVLLIGDSITGGYAKAVKAALDGKAEFYMNPRNAQSTWYGLEMIDEWLDLHRHLRSGADYLSLVDGLRNAFKTLDRVCPEYAGQGVELAGLVWFQGLADSASTSMTAAYRTNLVNLIRDLRKDLDAPRLPVVVAVLCPGNKGLRYVVPHNLQTIFDAQMAVGDPQQHPEFAGNVLSVDTCSEVQPPDRCPEAFPSPTTFGGNAGSYLGLGERLANAMLQLMDDAGRR